MCAGDCGLEEPEKKHADIFGVLHFTYFGLEHTETFSGIINSLAVGVLECRVDE